MRNLTSSNYLKPSSLWRLKRWAFSHRLRLRRRKKEISLIQRTQHNNNLDSIFAPLLLCLETSKLKTLFKAMFMLFSFLFCNRTKVTFLTPFPSSEEREFLEIAHNQTLLHLKLLPGHQAPAQLKNNLKQRKKYLLQILLLQKIQI